MKKLWFLSAALCLVCGSVFADIAAIQSCRTEGVANADVNRHDSSKLSVRASSPGNKAWIKFDVSGVDVSLLGSATLTVALHEGKSGAQSFDVGYVNDDCLDNIGWDERSITWRNAPGNDAASFSSLDAAKTTYLATVNFTDGMAGQAFEIDVLAALQSDTDGIVQIVLYNSPQLINLCTHDHAVIAQRPVIRTTEIHIGANVPVPADQSIAETTLPELSWENPEPNAPGTPIVCDVYFGTEPNRLLMEKVTLAAGLSSFQGFGPLANNTWYYWIVDCHDSSRGAAPADLLPGLVWSFYTDNNEAPSVDAGADQAVWLGKSGTAGQETVALNGTTLDDGLPNPPAAYTVQWTQVANDAPAVAVSPENSEEAAVVFTAPGTYVFMLTADDGLKQADDTVTVYVGEDACDASNMSTGATHDAADVNQDCIVDIADFAVIAEKWLTCTDTLTNCGR